MNATSGQSSNQSNGKPKGLREQAYDKLDEATNEVVGTIADPLENLILNNIGAPEAVDEYVREKINEEIAKAIRAKAEGLEEKSINAASDYGAQLLDALREIEGFDEAVDFFEPEITYAKKGINNMVGKKLLPEEEAADDEDDEDFNPYPLYDQDEQGNTSTGEGKTDSSHPSQQNDTQDRPDHPSKEANDSDAQRKRNLDNQRRAQRQQEQNNREFNLAEMATRYGIQTLEDGEISRLEAMRDSILIGEYLGAQIRRGAFPAFVILIACALTKDLFFDIILTWATGYSWTLLNWTTSLMMWVVLYVSLRMQGGMIKRLVIRFKAKFLKRLLLAFVIGSIPILADFIPEWTAIILVMKYEADKELRKYKGMKEEIERSIAQQKRSLNKYKAPLNAAIAVKKKIGKAKRLYKVGTNAARYAKHKAA